MVPWIRPVVSGFDIAPKQRFGYKSIKLDGFVKSPSAALRCILRHCSVPASSPHSSEFARLASGAFYFAIPILTFYKSIKLEEIMKSKNSNPLRIPR